MLVLLVITSVLILYYGRSLILVLILLEIIGFVVIFYISFSFSCFESSDYLVLVSFIVLVIEGVVALCGLIMMVSSSGSDYITSSFVLKQ